MDLFLSRPNEPLSKRFILKKVWADEGYRKDSIVELYVGYLRKKMEAWGGERIIHTLRGEGYVLKKAKN
jgi:hypothetical protein